MQCAWSAVLTTSTAWMLVEYSWPMRVKTALGAGALDPHGDAGKLRLEGLAELLGERQVHGGVEDELAFLLGRLDQRRRDGRGRRRRRPQRARQTARCRQRGRTFEHVAPVDRSLSICHRRDRSSGNVAAVFGSAARTRPSTTPGTACCSCALISSACFSTPAAIVLHRLDLLERPCGRAFPWSADAPNAGRRHRRSAAGIPARSM